MNSGDFEKLVLGRQSSGDRLVAKFASMRPNFSRDITQLIKNPGPAYPATLIGKSLYFLLAHELERQEVKSDGLILRSAVNTKVDALYFADLVGWVPALPNPLFTIDLFNLDKDDEAALMDLWVANFQGEVYSPLDEQTDLFRYNNGLFRWIKDHKFPTVGSFLVRPNLGSYRRKLGGAPEISITAPFWDFGQYANGTGRPENHFVLTPYHVANPQRRKNFVQMMAGYLVRTARKNMAKNKP